MSDEKNERIWKNGLIVFDTSALIEFYFYSHTIQQSVIDEIFVRMKGRIWIPAHVSYEYQKNREKVILKPIESYKGLIDEFKKAVRDHQGFQIKIGELKSKTKKDEKHPFFDQQLLKAINNTLLQQESQLEEFSEVLGKVVSEKTQLINDTVKNDRIREAIDANFDVGEPYNFEEMMDIVKEGKLRYEFDIPPGYEDSRGQYRKEGTQIFGDLFIWKQILQKAKLAKRPIALISKDMKKDWCYKSKSGHVESPREDLLREMFDYAGEEFWMYDISQLLVNAKKYLGSKIGDDEIEEVSKAIVQDNVPSCTFTWPVDNETSTGTNPLTKSLMYLIGANNSTLSVDWGDGSAIEDFASKQSIYHDYPGFGEYTVTVSGDIFWFCAMAIGKGEPNAWSHYPKVSKLSFSNSKNLDRLQCAFGSVENFDVTNLDNLTQLLVPGNQLKVLEVSNLEKLTILYCDHNELTDLDLSNNLFLGKLRCRSNKLTTLILERNNILEELDCSHNSLTSLNIRNNNNVKKIDVSYNPLSSGALNQMFIDLPVVDNGKINVHHVAGAVACNRSIAEEKGWAIVAEEWY